MATSTTITGMTDIGGAPSSADWLVVVDVSDTTQASTGTTKKMSVAEAFTTPNFTTSATVTGAAASAFAVGRTGATNPAFAVDSSVASQVAGLKVTGAATASTVAISVTDTGSNANLSINAKGTGAITLGNVSTGGVVITSGGLTITAGGLVVSASGATITGNSSVTGTFLVSSTLTGQAALVSTSATAGVGYATGAGGTIAQSSSRTTAVTLNKICGQITTNNTALAAGSGAAFTVNNSTVAATDTVVLSIVSGPTNPLSNVWVSAVGSGSFQITQYLESGTNDTGAWIINFAVLKAVAS